MHSGQNRNKCGQRSKQSALCAILAWLKTVSSKRSLAILATSYLDLEAKTAINLVHHKNSFL